MERIDKTKVRFSFDPQERPRARVKSGDVVCFECRDCYDEQITADGIDFQKLDMGRNNPITGPLYIEGAECGDVLRVEISDIELEDHAVMCVRSGCGETAICGAEASGRVTVRVTVLKQKRHVPTPFLVTFDSYITTAGNQSLDLCSEMAAQKMHRFLQEYTVLDRAQSAMLLSLAGNLRISQVVNPKKGCMMVLSKEIIENVIC